MRFPQTKTQVFFEYAIMWLAKKRVKQLVWKVSNFFVALLRHSPPLFRKLCYNVVMRSSTGQFIKGHSGNAGGRPRDEYKVAELARSYTTEAIDTLVDLMRHGKDDRVRGTAAQALLERGWGKPKVEVATTHKSDSDSFIEALREAAEKIEAKKNVLNSSVGKSHMI